MRGAARFATFLGRILMAVGFVLILVAWNGAASLDFIQGQFPFLLSGSVPGIAFIIIGAGLEYIQSVRQFSATRARQMAELNVAVVKLVSHVRDSGGLPVVNDADAVTAPAPVPAGVGAVAAATAAPAARSAAPAGSDVVVAGRSSFHRPECHLVADRDDMASSTRMEAEAQGLSACRVCKP